MLRGSLVLILALTIVSCITKTTNMNQRSEDVGSEPEYLNAGSSLSEGVRYGELLFISGKLGIRPERGIEPETRTALTKIKGALEEFGSSRDRVLKCTVFLADMAEWGAMNEVYKEFFPENKPARAAVGVNGLAAQARVEIECVAAA